MAGYIPNAGVPACGEVSVHLPRKARVFVHHFICRFRRIRAECRNSSVKHLWEVNDKAEPLRHNQYFYSVMNHKQNQFELLNAASVPSYDNYRQSSTNRKVWKNVKREQQMQSNLKMQNSNMQELQS
ncbi:hypothetical protein AMECASPLE_014473 [Ameca splendens]|uniref:Uncharacterized protein n=1 Tax=Ameca splendens TaxID=208324 RepID=A0ABV0XEQ8_9TELE